MAEIAVGAQAGAGEATLSALLQLDFSVKGVRADVNRLLKAQNAYQYGTKRVRLLDSATSAATGNLRLGLNGPAIGRRWEIRSLIVGGLTFTTTVLGTGEVYAVASPIAATDRSLQNMVDQAVSLPSVAFYSAGQMILRFPEELKIMIVGPSPSTPYVACGLALDMPDTPAVVETTVV